jgi:RNA ligase (TIGR02306 family)
MEEQPQTNRKLATIQRISKLEPHTNADTLEIARILGWQCVVKKGEFNEGDLIVYFEVDSLLPELPEFDFMKDRKYRVRTIKLRGQFSQGLIMPLSILDGKKFPDDTRENPIYEWKEGQEVTSLLGVKKYEPYIPPHLAGEIKGNFPAFLQKSDQTRVQVLRPLIEKYKGTNCVMTEKIDGSSVTFYIRDGEFGVCSRNLELKETEDNSIWKWARKNDVEEKLKSLNRNIAIQGEIVGPGINKNTLQLTYINVYFYDAFDIDTYKYIDFNEFKTILEDKLKLKTVPVVSYDFKLIDNIDDLIELSIGNSKINKEGMREGIVIRPITEIYDVEVMEDNNGRVTFKVVNPEYLLKYE